MNLLQLLVILGLSYTVNGKCLRPVPVKNFDLNRYSGKWFHAGIDSTNSKEAPIFEKSTCGKKYMILDSTRAKLGKWDVDLILGDRKSDLRGPFYLPNISRGHFKLFYVNGNYTYDFTVICTDYTNWAASYSCADVTPDHSSEFILFFLRNMSTYNDMVSNPEIQNCFSTVTNKTVNQIRKVPYDNCPSEYYV